MTDEKAVLEASRGILELGVSFFEEALSEVDVNKSIDDLKFNADMHDLHLVEVSRIETRKGLRFRFRDILRNERPELFGLYQQLDELEDRLRSKHEMDGVTVDAAPPNLPLVEQIKHVRKVVEACENAALVYITQQIERDEQAAGDSVRYVSQVFQKSWDDFRKEKEATNDG